MLRIIKKFVSKKDHVFHAPDNHSNKEENVDVMTFFDVTLQSKDSV